MLDTVTVRNDGEVLRGRRSVTSARPLKGGVAVLRYAATARSAPHTRSHDFGLVVADVEQRRGGMPMSTDTSMPMPSPHAVRHGGRAESIEVARFCEIFTGPSGDPCAAGNSYHLPCAAAAPKSRLSISNPVAGGTVS